VAFVERQDAARPELAREDDDREVGEPDVEIGVAPGLQGGACRRRSSPASSPERPSAPDLKST
jgi:hypothetical protein